MPHVLPTHVHPHHPPTTHRPSYYRRNTTAVEQEVPSNPQRQHTSTAVRTTAVHLWYARGWVGFICTSLRCSTFRGRARAVTHQAPTTHPPTNPSRQQYNGSGAVRIDQSTTAAQQHGSTHHSGTPVVRLELRGICTSLRFSTFRGRARAVPGRGFSRPPLADLGLVGRCIAGLMCGAGVALVCDR